MTKKSAQMQSAKRGPDFLILWLSALATVTGCIPWGYKGKISAFVADDGDRLKYLVEKTIILDGAPASGIENKTDLFAGVSSADTQGFQLSETTGFGASAQGQRPVLVNANGQVLNPQAGLLSALGQSFDNIGLCYYYADIAKSELRPDWHNLENPPDCKDCTNPGGPNDVARNNVIKRGRLVTSRLIRFSDLLLAMQEAGGTTAQQAQQLTTQMFDRQKALWSAATAAALTSGAVVMSETRSLAAIQRAVTQMQIQSGMAKPRSGAAVLRVGGTAGLRFTAPNTLANGDLYLSQINRHLAQYQGSNVQLIGSKAIGKIVTATVGNQEQQVAIVIDEGARISARSGLPVQRFFVRTTPPGQQGTIGRLVWREISQDAFYGRQILPSGFTKSVAAELAQYARNGLGQTSMTTRVLRAPDEIAQMGMRSFDNMLTQCKRGGMASIAVCAGFMAASVGVLSMYSDSRSHKMTDLERMQFQTRFAGLAQNAQLEAQLGSLFDVITKTIRVPVGVLETLRENLIRKGETSPLPGCATVFQPEVDATPGTGLVDAQGRPLVRAEPKSRDATAPVIQEPSTGDETRPGPLTRESAQPRSTPGDTAQPDASVQNGDPASQPELVLDPVETLPDSTDPTLSSPQEPVALAEEDLGQSLVDSSETSSEPSKPEPGASTDPAPGDSTNLDENNSSGNANPTARDPNDPFGSDP